MRLFLCTIHLDFHQGYKSFVGESLTKELWFKEKSTKFIESFYRLPRGELYHVDSLNKSPQQVRKLGQVLSFPIFLTDFSQLESSLLISSHCQMKEKYTKNERNLYFSDYINIGKSADASLVILEKNVSKVRFEKKRNQTQTPDVLLNVKDESINVANSESKF